MSKRITVPDDHIALILPPETAKELFSLMQAFRKPTKRVADRLNSQSSQIVAGLVLLSIIENNPEAVQFKGTVDD